MTITRETARERMATLTDREREYVELVVSDSKQATIARLMDLSKGRVGQIRLSVIGRLGVFSSAGIGYVAGLAVEEGGGD